MAMRIDAKIRMQLTGQKCKGVFLANDGIDLNRTDQTNSDCTYNFIHHYVDHGRKVFYDLNVFGI